MDFGRLLVHRIHGFLKLLIDKDYDLDASTFKLAMTSTARRPGIIFELYAADIVLDVFGFRFLVRSGALGLRSTMLDLNVNNFLKIIDDVNDEFFGMFMSSCLRPWMKTLTYWYTMNGLTLALVGNRNPFLPYKLFLNNMGKNGMTAA